LSGRKLASGHGTDLAFPGLYTPRNFFQKEFTVDHSVFECARCGVHLPLKRDLAADDQWVCANCGWPMPGVLDPAARESIMANVTPVAQQHLVEIRRRHDCSYFEPWLKRFFSDNRLSSSYRM
jgi:ribosomal protein L37AE/L43A